MDVEVGEIVIAGTTNLPGTVLMTIGDMTRMRVRADVDETDVGLVRSGQAVSIYLQADQDDPIPGTVDLISPKGTKLAEVVSFETLISVDGKHESLRPEMTATVEIEVKRATDALSVPVQAVVHRRLKDLPNTPLFRDWVAKQPKTPAEKGKDQAVRYVKVGLCHGQTAKHVRACRNRHQRSGTNRDPRRTRLERHRHCRAISNARRDGGRTTGQAGRAEKGVSAWGEEESRREQVRRSIEGEAMTSAEPLIRLNGITKEYQMGAEIVRACAGSIWKSTKMKWWQSWGRPDPGSPPCSISSACWTCQRPDNTG